MAEVALNTPEGKPIDYTKVWLDQHYSKENGFLVVEKHISKGGEYFVVPFQWGIGPFTVKGSIDTSTMTIHVEFDIQIPIWGSVTLVSGTGNLNDGVKFSFDFAVASGSIKFYLWKSNQLWIRIDVNSIVGDFHNDYYILTI